MSRGKKEDLPPDWVKDKLSLLRKKLEQNEGWPEGADGLLADLARPAQASPVGDDDYQMLSLVVNDALEGVDITVRYPGFYRKLLADGELRQAFLDALAVLTGAELEPLPPEFSRDLGFLQTAVSPPPTIQQTASDKWQAAWHLLAEQLNQKFFPSFQPVYRSSATLEEMSTVLLRRDFSAGGRPYDLILEAVSPLDAPEQLQLTLLITPLTDGPLPEMAARLQWGDAVLTAVPDRYGRARFPLLPLNTILDETGQTILSDLNLSLETV